MLPTRRGTRAIKLTTNALVYEAIQRIFRNAMVGYIRRRLQAAHPDTWREALKKPFLAEEWAGIERAVALSRSTSAAKIIYKDEVDYLSVNHFINIFDRYRDLLISNEGIHAGLAKKRREDVYQLLREIKSVRDPMSHPTGKDLDPIDSWRVVDSARRVLKILGLPGTRKLETIQTEIFTLLANGDPVWSPSSRWATVREVAKHPAVGMALPDTSSPLVGRDHELSDLIGLLRKTTSRLVTITGLGGIGKTRLALEAGRTMADIFTDGVVFVPLHGAEGPETVPSLLMNELHLLSAQDDETAILDYLKRMRLLILFDGFEKVMASKPFVVKLLSKCQRLKVIVTSQRPLGLEGEANYRIGPLAFPLDQGVGMASLLESPSARLLLHRAKISASDLRLTKDDVDALQELLVRLEGIPLAIVLVGPLLKHLSVGEVLAGLDRILAKSKTKGGLSKGSLTESIQYSYALLNDDEQAAFRRLSAFWGGFGRDEAAVVANAGWAVDVRTCLDSLETASLIEREGEARFWMLDALRTFAYDQLNDTSYEELESTLDAHSFHFADHCFKAVARSVKPIWLEYPRTIADLHFALNWSSRKRGSQEQAFFVVTALGRAAVAFEDFPLQEEVREAMRRILRNPLRRVEPTTRIRALWTASYLFKGTDPRRTAKYLREGSRLALKAGLDGRTLYQWAISAL